MKLLSATALLLASPLVSAASFPALFDPSQATIRIEDAEKFPVKGDNPLEYCEDPLTHLLTIDSVNLTPNPPKPGQTLTIEASGTFHETITKGATVNLEVKWGVITLVKQTVDLCEQIENVDLKCPLEKGKMVLTKNVDLPKQIPPGKYSVLADVYTEDSRKVTCLKADNIEFKIHF
ncbi:Phosphatidylglycerol/phosphatidylinositol transfer protein [Penicillium canariense]|uniref:Phosphatidylglycerol/phosphatidylinositol transfer protein n=1 Tax=Penicillium canariense TaxID=189055 RepID=A0A9W9IKI7_9EURO|nr:Phosphatidylglycerol/phosphatidylinositol transfer protein [Penicillium canariense]KAJ5175976.1 Phosphatidylglycerol/phosphatidylinositol transfer protein [Penicillium canariense]